MQDHLLDRIYGEYQAYKASILSLSSAEIFSKCYEIDIMTNIYDILMERAEKLAEGVIAGLLEHQNIIAELYDRWLKRDDALYAEIDDYVSYEIESIADKTATQEG